MKIFLCALLVGSALAKPTGPEAVSVACNTKFYLNDKDLSRFEFQSLLGITGECSITITAPKDEHIELQCSGSPSKANGDASTENFHGTGPVVITFTPTKSAPQLFCKAGLEEEHHQGNAFQGTLTTIDDLDAACNKQPKDDRDKGVRSSNLAATETRINTHNAHCHSTWTAGVNCLSDLTEEEVIATMTGRAPPPSEQEMALRTARAERELMNPLRSLRQELPESVDLASIGRVSPAKNQGGCGSCSVFAAVSTIESCMHKVTDVLPTDLSEQHMLDCAYGFGGSGCGGGSSDRYHEWMYARHNGELAIEDDYTYRAATSGQSQCRNSSVETTSYGAKVTSHQESWYSSEEDIMRLLAQGHSVTTGMNVVGDFYSYRSGVYQSDSCKNCRNSDGSANRDGCPQNHDITIVGYGVEDGVKYWKLKNSWGSGWGENGFGKFLRGVGHCGLDIDFSVPMCTASGPSPNPGPTDEPSPGPEPTEEPAPVPGTCGGDLLPPSGSLSNEGYPTAYKNDQDCIWVIAQGDAPENSVVKFTVHSGVFELESNNNCRYDYVQFLNRDESPISVGEGGAADEGKICGRTRPEPIFTKGPGAIVHFHSDGSVVKPGFHINYEFIESESCSGQNLNTAVGVQPVIISSPDYPSDYPTDVDCDWTITVPSGQKVRLVFESFITEFNYDKVKVFDGDSNKSPSLGSFSGNSVPTEVMSTGTQLHVRFNSDGSVTKKGFNAIASGAKK
jgi:C1A family cysteine protease